jgi:hypothetical protein
MNGPQTTTEIRLAGIQGYGAASNVGQLMQRTKDAGYVKADRGRWYLTQEGKDKIKHLISTGNVSAVNNDLRRQFNR